MTDRINVFQFMVVRAPQAPGEAESRRSLIHDDVLLAGGRANRDLFSSKSSSLVARTVYVVVVCSDGDREFSTEFEYLLRKLLPLLKAVPAPCGDSSPDDLSALLEVGQRETFWHGGVQYVVPNRLADLPSGSLPAFFDDVRRAVEEATLAAEGDVTASRAGRIDELMGALRRIRDNTPFYNTMFKPDGGSADWVNDAKAALFDALYLLYILRHEVAVSFDDILGALQLIHALEALAVDELLLLASRTSPLPPAEDAMLRALLADRAYLRGSTTTRPPPPKLIRTVKDLAEFLNARPVIHPLIVKLHGFRKPFNHLRSIGTGDLKVVKQWLVGYEVGEIAHVENVLIGETRDRVHRRLEKTEDVFTSTREDNSESQEDTQTTDRYELKRETDNLLNTSINATANLGLNVTSSTPGGYTIVTTAGAGFAYNRAQTDQAKTTTNFAREVIGKAVSRIETRSSTQRTTTKLFETEETTTHGFKNERGKKHVSGIYRWLNKRYRAQVFNYGKRMMFEFMIAEPAAFLVEARLRAHEAATELPDVPQRPPVVSLPAALSNLTIRDITVEKYDELARKYDLNDLTPPVFERSIDFIDSTTGKAQFAETGMDSSRWQARTFTCRGGVKGYSPTRLRIEGYLFFWGRQGLPTDTNNVPSDVNTFEIRANGQVLHQGVNNDAERWWTGFGLFPFNIAGDVPVSDASPFDSDDLTITFGFWDIAEYDISVQADLVLDTSVADAWRRSVLNRVLEVENRKVDEINRQREQTYQSELATYRNRLDELRAMSVNDLLRSRSEPMNRQVMLIELKRQVLAMITRELASEPAHDRYAFMDGLATRAITTDFPRFDVTEEPAGEPTSVRARFVTDHSNVDFPVPDLSVSRRKGRHVQFLEQAFEWEQLGFQCHPYFHTIPPRWIQLMDRGDHVDPAFTAFLSAGYARVLVAVTPAYDDAVLHYLCSGQPWAGGRSPVIGDPLFIPLHEELRQQTDDLAGATPEGDPWDFTLPTSLVYLEDSTTALPIIPKP